MSWSLVGRLSIGVLDIPLILLVQDETGSYALAGATIALDAIGIATSAPLRGRALDRFGSRRAIPPLAILRAVVLGGLWPIAHTRSLWAILLVGVLAGLTVPPLAASMRLQWRALLGRESPRVRQAYAFESSAQLAMFVLGPLLAAAGIAALGSGATIVASAVLLLIGALGFSARTVEDRSDAPPTAGAPVRPIRVAGVRTLVGATVVADAALGIADVTVTAFAKSHGHPSAAGLLIAVECLAAVVGGALYGALAGLLILTGVPIAAQWATTYLVLDDVTPEHAAGEAMSWLSAANAAGVGAGDALAGAIVETAGTSGAFITAAGLLAAGALAVASRQWTLAEHQPSGTTH